MSDCLVKCCQLYVIISHCNKQKRIKYLIPSNCLFILLINLTISYIIISWKNQRLLFSVFTITGTGNYELRVRERGSASE